MVAGLFVFGLAATAAFPVAWIVDPRSQDYDGTHPRPFRDNGWDIFLVGAISIAGILSIVMAILFWYRVVRTLPSRTRTGSTANDQASSGQLGE